MVFAVPWALVAAESTALAQAAAGAPSVTDPAAVRAPSPDDFGLAMRRGSQAFARGERSLALASFERALSLASAPADVATAHFNRAACLFELGRFDEAEAGFAMSARLDPGYADSARLHAGFAAVRNGRLAEARRYLQGAAQGDAGKRKKLRSQIEQAEEEGRRVATQQALSEAFRQLEGGDSEKSAESFSRLLASDSRLTDAQRAEAHYGLARALQSHGQFDTAMSAIREARRLVPGEGEYEMTRGEILWRRGDASGAITALRRSLAMPLSADSRRFARDTLEILTRPPWTPGLSGSALGGLGVDSNADQSGAAVSRDTATAELSRASPFAHVAVAVSYVAALSKATALGVNYALNAMLFSQDSVRELSLAEQQAGVDFHWTPARDLWLRARLNVGYALSGLANLTPFATEYGGAMHLRYAQSDTRRLDLQLAAVQVDGHGGQPYLDGQRVVARAAQSLRVAGLKLRFTAQALLNAIGTLVLDVQDGEYSLPPSPGYRYDVPLAYFAPGLEARAERALTSSLSLGARIGLEHRAYLRASRIVQLEGTVIDDSVKRRRDLRPQAGLDAVYALDRGGSWAVLGDYRLFLSRSNLERGAGAEHAFDYQNRNFLQHTLAVSFVGRF